MNLRIVNLTAALGLLTLPVSPGVGRHNQDEACTPSSGWSSRVERFRSRSIERQLRKVDFDDGVISTHGMSVKRVFGIIHGHVNSYLQYRDLEDGPQYRLVLDENYQGRAHVNYHFAYKVGLVVDGEYIELEKAGQEDTFPTCGADNNCMSHMVSYYIIPHDLFAAIEAMPEATLLTLRIQNGGEEYRACRDYIAAAEFRLMRAAIARGAED